MPRFVKQGLWPITRGALCISLLLLAGHHPTPTGAMRASRSTVRVESSQCPGLKTGSGFVWNSAVHIVTSFHVVAGCRQVEVRFANGQLLPARIIRRLIRHDLALLQVSGSPTAPVLSHSTVMPTSTVWIYAWGYPVKIKGLLDSQVRRREVGTTLRNLLPSDLQAKILQIGMPHLDSQIYLLGGERVLPGESGGPIVNAGGAVVAIVDGGLEQGAAEINWAIPAAQLPLLRASTEPTSGHAGAGLLFASEVVDTFPTFVAFIDNDPRPLEARFSEEIVRCGGIDLAKVRTRTFAELTQFTDDPFGLQQIIALMGPHLQPTDEFDVYQHLTSGATAVVPAGTVFASGSGFCLGDAAGGRVRIYLRVLTVRGPAAVQQVSLAFESDLGRVLGGGNWVIDPAWTMIAPLQRPDGLVARRKGSTGFTGALFGQIPSRYAFESLASRGDVFLGIAAVRTDMSPAKLRQQQACGLNPELGGCPALLEELQTVAKAMAGVHLSTFPIQ
jgi:hypothetical protein